MRRDRELKESCYCSGIAFRERDGKRIHKETQSIMQAKMVGWRIACVLQHDAMRQTGYGADWWKFVLDDGEKCEAIDGRVN